MKQKVAEKEVKSLGKRTVIDTPTSVDSQVIERTGRSVFGIPEGKVDREKFKIPTSRRCVKKLLFSTKRFKNGNVTIYQLIETIKTSLVRQNIGKDVVFKHEFKAEKGMEIEY